MNENEFQSLCVWGIEQNIFECIEKFKYEYKEEFFWKVCYYGMLDKLKEKYNLTIDWGSSTLVSNNNWSIKFSHKSHSCYYREGYIVLNVVSNMWLINKRRKYFFLKSTINNQFMILLTEEIDKFVNRMLDDIEDIISLNVNIGFSFRECDRM